MAKTIIVHMIGNAHLDPVWLWQWQRGSDEAIATCRAACDLLDDYPEATFTRGEAWVYEQVRKLDPVLFKRIKKHIQRGKWEVTGGWWIQADTNLPLGETLSKNIKIGLEWFRKHTGIKNILVAYLVDSFGHGHYLPRIIKQAGQKYFVMMRPSAGEKKLPSPLFRWRSPDGYEVLTYRIPSFYAGEGDLTNKIKATLENMPADIRHVMCFYGVGNHGGGPTRRTVEWIMAHKDFAPGIHLEFSTTARFFAEVEKYAEKCPLVDEQLEPHAVGCYSVCGNLKRIMRSAELELIDCENIIKRYSAPSNAKKYLEQLNEQWESLCFNQFHDILPGSAICEAIEIASMQIGGVRDKISKIVHDVLRGESGIPAACKEEGHRLHVVNRLNMTWHGIIEDEIWMDWMGWEHHLEDENGKEIVSQVVPPSFLEFEQSGKPSCKLPRIIFEAKIPPEGYRTFRIVAGDGQARSPCCSFADNKLSNGIVEVCFNRWGIVDVFHVERGNGWSLLEAPFAFECLADRSDTWGHGVEIIGGPAICAAEFDKAELVYSGPLRTMVRLRGMIGNSKARLFVWLNKDESAVNMRLDISYQEPLTVLKACFSPHYGIKKRMDRVCGGWIERKGDGKEYVLHHAICIENNVLGKMGLLLPDSFAIDGTAVCIRPTLIRNNVHAYNQWLPYDWKDNSCMQDRFGTDEGPNSIRIVFVVGESAEQKNMEKLINYIMRPPHVWDDFKGNMARLKHFDK